MPVEVNIPLFIFKVDQINFIKLSASLMSGECSSVR